MEQRVQSRYYPCHERRGGRARLEGDVTRNNNADLCSRSDLAIHLNSRANVVRSFAHSFQTEVALFPSLQNFFRDTFAVIAYRYSQIVQVSQINTYRSGVRMLQRISDCFGTDPKDLVVNHWANFARFPRDHQVKRDIVTGRGASQFRE